MRPVPEVTSEDAHQRRCGQDFRGQCQSRVHRHYLRACGLSADKCRHPQPRDSEDRSSAPLDMTVDRGLADTELRRNLRDDVRPVPVRASLLVYTLATFTCRGPSWVSARQCTPGRGQRPDRPSYVQTSRRAQFCDRAEDLEDHPSDRGRGVDALVEHDQVDLAVLQVLGQGGQVLKGAAEPIQLRNHQQRFTHTRGSMQSGDAPSSAVSERSNGDGRLRLRRCVGARFLLRAGASLVQSRGLPSGALLGSAYMW